MNTPQPHDAREHLTQHDRNMLDAAKDMLKALRDLETLGDCTVPKGNVAGHLMFMRDKARAAIARAEGGGK